MTNRFRLLVLFLLFFFSLLCSIELKANQIVDNDTSLALAVKRAVEDHVNSPSFIKNSGYTKMYDTSVDSVKLLPGERKLLLYFDLEFSYIPMRESLITGLDSAINTVLAGELKISEYEYFSNGFSLSELIPNFYLDKKRHRDKKRMKDDAPHGNVVYNDSKPWLKESQLSNKNIALWHSHGWYYEAKLHRWEWQRARLFKTVEDLYPMAYTLNFLVPMLENAGANIFIPRERDWQLHEVIVDNNSSTGASLLITHIPAEEIPGGFSIGNPPYIHENPFTSGTVLGYSAGRSEGVAFSYIPEIPETGEYPVYISYKSLEKSAVSVTYRLYHSGGRTDFSINQQMGGGTWIYLGKFHFTEGVNSMNGRLEVLFSKKNNKEIITSDAVRFGSGYGNISRNGLVSGRPRYQEAARYYLQYAGFPDTLVWHLNREKEDDYADDYQSRGEWVNYLMGAPSGPKGDRNAKGLGIPIDLAFAFHTDAGITDNDTVIGTLGIYSTKVDTGFFPGGLSKNASRDLTDIIQTQIVEDIRQKYDPAWVRRGMWDRGYSEAYRPMTPAMLLELFSHQNFLDSRFGAEPQFRFDVSRSIYKGIVRFLSALNNSSYTIQALPVTHFCTEISQEGQIHLSWKQQHDPLEPFAEPEGYIVYTKTGEGGYDNGTRLRKNSFVLENPSKDSIYSFKITAFNKGGESFPSEELSVCLHSGNPDQILIVNAFDRLGTPAWFNDTQYGGYLDAVDEGVPYRYDYHTVGQQYDFFKKSPWLDDDSPGFGASSADLEEVVFSGNTFDFSYVHGKAIRNAGYSFASVSDEVFEDHSFSTRAYAMVDILAGEEKSSYYPKNDTIVHYQLFTQELIEKLDSHLKEGGSLFISGAHIASDFHQNRQDSLVGRLLKIKWRTSNASAKGDFYFVDSSFVSGKKHFSFNTRHHSDIYRVEGADALEPADSSAQTLIRYSENNMSAAVAHKGDYGVVAFGFPFETILEEKDRNILMREVINFLLNNN